MKTKPNQYRFHAKTHNYEDGVITNLKLDYSVPISPTSIFEIGYKGIFRTIKADFETSNFLNATYVRNPAASNLLIFQKMFKPSMPKLKMKLARKERVGNMKLAYGQN